MKDAMPLLIFGHLLHIYHAFLRDDPVDFSLLKAKVFFPVERLFKYIADFSKITVFSLWSVISCRAICGFARQLANSSLFRRKMALA